ncbi:hypothetical protein C8R46DRAFT_256507 [Mycena filopes]|nr:hypothetical protein C8R46DRAFT_256507 [Mycena filopes]
MYSIGTAAPTNADLPCSLPTMRRSTKAALVLLYILILGYARLINLQVALFYVSNFYLYFVVALTLLGIVQTVVLTPLDKALSEEDGNERVNPEPEPIRPRPHDEESLINAPDSEPEDAESFCDQIFVLRAIVLFLVAGTLFAVAATVRPARTGVLLGSYHVLRRVVGHTAAVFLGPPVVIFAPIFILWVKAKRLGAESAWFRNFTICRRVITASFVYLLAMEGTICYRWPPSEAILAHLTWQASLLSPLFDWLGFGAYPLALLWFFTDKAGVYLLRRGMKYLRDNNCFKPGPAKAPAAAAPSPRPVAALTQILLDLVPVAMLCNASITAAPTLAEGLTSAAIRIALTTLATLSIFLFDLAIYWSYYYALDRKREGPSPADVMAISVVALVVRDPATGQPMWKTFSKWMKTWEEQAAESAASDSKAKAPDSEERDAAGERGETEKSAHSEPTQVPSSLP